MTGPDDEFDPSVNGGFSSKGEEDAEGYDDMPVECGWQDESDDDEEDDDE